MTTCCPPISGPALTGDQAAGLADRFKALADPHRLRLLSLIASRGEVCGCELVEPLGLAQPTVSHHLKVLREAGLLRAERRGKWIYYEVDRSAIDDVRAAI